MRWLAPLFLFLYATGFATSDSLVVRVAATKYDDCGVYYSATGGAGGTPDHDIDTVNTTAGGTRIYFGSDGASPNYYDSAGFRFANTKVDASYTIDSAFMFVNTDLTVSTNGVKTQIKAELSTSSATFLTEGDYVSRTRTTDSVTWNIDTTWTLNVVAKSPDIHVLIQDLVNQGSWTTSSFITLFVQDNGSTAGHYRIVTSADQSLTTDAQLKVYYHYTAGGAAGGSGTRRTPQKVQQR